MGRKIGRLVLLMLITALTFSFGTSISAKEKEETYRTIIEIEDWGAAVTKLIVKLGHPIPQGVVTVDTFDVYTEEIDDRIPEIFKSYGHQEGYRTVTDAYVADKDGNKIDKGRGEYAVLELEIGPEVSLGNVISYDFINGGGNAWVDYNYTITQVEDIVAHPGKAGTISDLVIDTFAGETRELVDDFSFGEATYGDITLPYAYYEPAKDKGKNPLIVWLHGGGEGGTDPTIPLSANKAAAFASNEVQAIYGGAHVLVPQAPTRWMDGETGDSDGTSIYSEALMSLIEDHIANNPDIDPKRVYVGGASNGGYMTMLLIRDNPGYFAAAFPICEGLRDTLITDEDILNMIKTPIWFVHAANDPVLLADLNSVPTYNRMIEAGAENVYLSLFEDVRDTSGLYFEDDGITPYEYNGHFAWVHMYNNIPTETIDGEETNIMEWMAAQSK